MEHGSQVPRAARLAVAAIFFVNGAGIANWVVRIPAVRDGLHLSTGMLGVALLGMSVGALLAMPFVGWLVARFGSRPLTFASALAFLAALPLPALAPSLPLLAAALVALGASSAALGVSMNAHAVLVERRYDRPIMSSFHALFSLGGMAGSASGGALAALGLRPLPHLMLMAAVLAALSLGALARFLPREADALGQHGPAFARPSRTLLALGAMAFCVLLGEGAMADWTAVYLRDVLGTGPGLAAAGYGAFSFAMASGRLAGDALGQRLGSARLVRTGGAVTAVGLGGALAVGGAVPAIVGFACVGAGLSTLFPNLLSAAGRTPGQSSGTAIAALSTVGYTGFLAGPPLIGLAAEWVGLRTALGVVVLCGVLIVGLAGAVRSR